MPRIPYVYPEVGSSAIADVIRQRRANGKLIALDGVLLNAPVIASGYSQLLGAVRSKSSLQPALRELLILRVAALNYAAYEWKQHVPLGREAGLAEEQIEWIKEVGNIRTSEQSERPPAPPSFPPVLQATLAFVDCSTIDIRVPLPVFAALKEHLNNQEIMEVTATIATYNMVSRILVALDVENMADQSI